MKNAIKVAVMILTVAGALGCASTRGRELPLGSPRECKSPLLPKDIKLLYVVSSGPAFRKPAISQIFGSEMLGFALATIEEKHKGATKGSMLAGMVFEEEKDNIGIWFSGRRIPFASAFTQDAEVKEVVGGTKVYFSESSGKQEWNFLPSDNVLIAAESLEGADRVVRILEKLLPSSPTVDVNKKWRQLFRPLSGKRVFWGRLFASKAEDISCLAENCEPLYMIAGPVMKGLKPQHLSFALSVEGQEADLSFAFAESSPRDLKKAVRACKCTAALKEVLMSAPVSSNSNGTVLTIRSNLRHLSELVEDLYDKSEEDEDRLEYPKEVLRTPPHAPKAPDDDE
jgi:hypothetical protein